MERYSWHMHGGGLSRTEGSEEHPSGVWGGALANSGFEPVVLRHYRYKSVVQLEAKAPFSFISRQLVFVTNTTNADFYSAAGTSFL